MSVSFRPVGTHSLPLVQPETIAVVTIPAAAPGDYAFYCDTCCGGKENPTMQGVLKIRA